MKRINYLDNLLEPVQAFPSQAVFKLDQVALKCSFPQQRDQLTPFSGQHDARLQAVTAPSGLENLWVLWIVRTVQSVEDKSSHMH